MTGQHTWAMRSASPDLFLSLCTGYCLTWEVAGTRAPEQWGLLRQALRTSDELAEHERWAAELYEERLPTAQEERTLLSRLEQVIHSRRQMEEMKALIQSLLPESLRAAAAKHSLLQALQLPQEPSVVQTWLKRSGLHLPATADTPLPWGGCLGEREADFERFLSLPRFEDNFRKYWHSGPKNRSNRETRALVTIGAIFGQSLRIGTPAELEQWTKRLGSGCHYSSQTQIDVLDIAADTAGESYDATELTYRLLADANPQDVTYLKDFIGGHLADMTGFASEMLRLMEL